MTGGAWYVENVDIVESRLVGMSLMNIWLSVLISTSYGANCPGWGNEGANIGGGIATESYSPGVDTGLKL